MSSVRSLTYIATNSSAVVGVDAAAEAHRVLHRRIAVREARVDRLAQHRGDVVEPVEVAPRSDEAERQRQARLLLPPGAEVEHLVEPVLRVGELAFVDQSPARARPDVTSPSTSSNGRSRVRTSAPSASRSTRVAVVSGPGVTISSSRSSSSESGSRATTIGP